MKFNQLKVNTMETTMSHRIRDLARLNSSGPQKPTFHLTDFDLKSFPNEILTIQGLTVDYNFQFF